MKTNYSLHKTLKNSLGIIIPLTLILLLTTQFFANVLPSRASELGKRPFSPTIPATTNATLLWNTFLGSSDLDSGNDITIDSSGNIYVVGESYENWGSPINDHTDGLDNTDVYVAKLNSSGTLQWNTFLGSKTNNATYDYGYAIELDTSNNIYITGFSESTWGDSPINPHAGSNDAFVAKLNNSGVLQWHTFLGGAADDEAYDIAIDASGNSYIVGGSDSGWGSPLNLHAGGRDAFVVKLNSSGVYQWHTYLGGGTTDTSNGIALDGNTNIYISGVSLASWKTPLNPHAGGLDAFAAKLNSSGDYQWHTFMGDADVDFSYSIDVDGNANVYLTGLSESTWGDPMTPHAGGNDAFITKLNSSGSRQWHTFLGGSGDDIGYGIVVAETGTSYIVGESNASWGTPLNTYTGDSDALVAMLNSDGEYQWHTFLGSSLLDVALDIALDENNNGYIIGKSENSWGSPVNPFTGAAGNEDAFIQAIDMDGYFIYLPMIIR